MIGALENMMTVEFPFGYASEHIYKLRLSFALQCFRCPYIDKRLYALREVSERARERKREREKESVHESLLFALARACVVRGGKEGTPRGFDIP